MIGAIVGDIAGARFEFDNHKTMLNSSTYSDDSVMTLAIAKAILLWKEMESLTY